MLSHDPEVIVLNAGAAQFLKGGPITMTKEDVYETHRAAPGAKIFVCHMEALNHCLLTREELDHYCSDLGMSSQVLIPKDGDSCSY
ncbi:hypothetical protein [Fictibacillus sp. FJAT-27399]|uniref:hypothetical protein n=1 Tax=Fictibacillus sp. FJAT-27399 TaxID=1729689 RepID=UPI000783BBD8|nr:hypothetical protein [Fictibacillus sp. FJAT-27399]